AVNGRSHVALRFRLKNTATGDHRSALRVSSAANAILLTFLRSGGPMSDNKHSENWVDFYKAALLEEDPEKLLQRTDMAVDALRSRIWVLVGELHGEHNGHSTDSGEWKALNDALRTLVPCVIA